MPTVRSTVGPDKAVISAKAKLNGIPAELDLVEPLRDDGPPRSRKVALVLDDKTRASAMPGLSPLISGTIKVAIDKSGEGGSQNVAADLTERQAGHSLGRLEQGAGHSRQCHFHHDEVRRHHDAVRFRPRRKDFLRRRRCGAGQRRPVVGALQQGRLEPGRRCRGDGEAIGQGLCGRRQRQCARRPLADQAVHRRRRHRHQDHRRGCGFGQRRCQFADRLPRRGTVESEARLQRRRLQGERAQGQRHGKFGRRHHHQQHHRKRRAHAQHEVGRRRRHTALPQHLRAHGRRLDHAGAQRRRRWADDGARSTRATSSSSTSRSSPRSYRPRRPATTAA